MNLLGNNSSSIILRNEKYENLFDNAFFNNPSTCCFITLIHYYYVQNLFWSSFIIHRVALTHIEAQTENRKKRIIFVVKQCSRLEKSALKRCLEYNFCKSLLG